VALIVALVVAVVIVFFYSLFKVKTKGPPGPSGPSGPSPDPSSGAPPKDFVVHLAQGSSLQLQGVPQPGDDLAAIKQDLAAIQTTLKSIDSEQKMQEKNMCNQGFRGEDQDWKDMWRRDDWESPGKGGRIPSQAPTAAPTAGQRLPKMVHYSADLATQSPDQRNKMGASDRWSGGPTRFYGGAPHSCSSQIHSSDF
jgi:hypothetical protein